MNQEPQLSITHKTRIAQIAKIRHNSGRLAGSIQLPRGK